ncbi:GNAT family N-acetyltransferase [Brevibacillus sp. SYSU BS000544]|uniref:GNAT family N-acetyltransferase n=1 Tax=Brevibacillus sp. SYSU BS000544 TaxID=3416443 RepID=UPI003CE49BF6
MFQCQIDQHITLRLPVPEDAPKLFALITRSKDYLRPWLTWVEMTQNLKHSQSYIEYLRNQFTAKRVCKVGIWYDDEMVGEVGFTFINGKDRSGSLTFWVAEEYLRRGIASKSCRAMIHYGFEQLGLNRVEIAIAKDNKRAIALAKSLGFEKEGILREAECRYEKYVDVIMFSMLADEWMNVKY